MRPDERREFMDCPSIMLSLLSCCNSHSNTVCLTLFFTFSCRLVTFYFTHKFSPSDASEGDDPVRASSRLTQEDEDEATALIEEYGSYLDIYKCLVSAGKLRSKTLVDKVVNVARYDIQHREAVKALQKAKTILFYEPVSPLVFQNHDVSFVCMLTSLTRTFAPRVIQHIYSPIEHAICTN